MVLLRWSRTVVLVKTVGRLFFSRCLHLDDHATALKWKMTDVMFYME